MLKTRAGIVGPKDTVQLILDIAKEFNDKLTPVPYVYQSTKEVTNIMKYNQHMVDLWIFAGPALYPFAQLSGSDQLCFFLKLDGSSLAQVLLKIGYKEGKSLNRLSIDMLTEKEVNEIYIDLNLPYEEIYVHEYNHETPLNDLLTFHQSLYEKGKIDICLTCLYFIYEQLQSQGIPAYRITPTRSNIRETLKTAIQQWETIQFKQSQIAVMLIKVNKMESLTDHHTVSYDLHRLNLELQAAILNFSESISGSFVTLGLGTYIIFSTRGSLQETGQQSTELIEKLALITDLPANIGIGYGETSLAAEKNARLALHHAENHGERSAFLVDSNGTIEGPLNDKTNITFGYRIENSDISEKLKKAGVTITTFNKILSIQKKQGNQAVTANSIAEWLKMTQRNARRILNSLVEHDLAEVIGEEAPAKGRPRKIYRVGIKQYDEFGAYQ